LVIYVKYFFLKKKDFKKHGPDYNNIDDAFIALSFLLFKLTADPILKTQRVLQKSVTYTDHASHE